MYWDMQQSYTMTSMEAFCLRDVIAVGLSLLHSAGQRADGESGL